MDMQKVREVLQKYDKYLSDLGYTPQRFDHDRFPQHKEAENHLLWMCRAVDTSFSEGKAKRWLGFIQGAFWILRLRTIEEMKRDNRPTLEDKAREARE